jgi:hypothetical protein
MAKRVLAVIGGFRPQRSQPGWLWEVRYRDPAPRSPFTVPARRRETAVTLRGAETDFVLSGGPTIPSSPTAVRGDSAFLRIGDWY